MADMRAESLVASERRSLADDFISFGPDAPTILEWDAQGLLEHLLLRERRPDLIVGPRIPIAAIADRAEQERARLVEQDWAAQVASFREGPGRFSPVRGLDRIMNTAEYFVHHEDLRRARRGWEARDLGEPGERELWAGLKYMARMLVRADVDITLVSPLGGLRVPAKRSEGTVRVHGPASELLLWVYGRDRVAQVRIEGDAHALAVLQRSQRGA
ncbi:TIGR03085 family metal-binding protein [Brachybacterium huguangmaarense]